MVTEQTIEQLTDPRQLRAFAARLAREQGRSERTILEAVAAITVREQRRRADDMADVRLLGRIHQCAVQVASTLH